MEKTTELVFIIDKSGSMQGLENDTIGGFNSMLSKHKECEGVCKLSTIFFSDDSKVIHNRVDIKEVNPLSLKDYQVGGCTALLDAIANAICYQNVVQKVDKCDNVIFVIITDGQENASREYNDIKVKKMIEEKQEKNNWQFIFLGANIDVVHTAHDYGIRQENAVEYCCDSKGVGLNFEVLSCAIASFRKSGSIKKNWSKEIKEDCKKRRR